jgi:CTP:molybdopterin cytidylyltransferase MocA
LPPEASLISHDTVIPAIVLAAGQSTRMGGRAKANLPLDSGDTFLTRIVRTFLAASVDDVVVVLGHDAESVAATFLASGLPARLVVNRNYASGQLSSILTGLRAVDRPGVAAVLLTLVDVPLVTPRTVQAVIDCYRRSGAPIVRPTAEARHGHPVLVDRRLFEELRHSDASAGIKPVIRRHASADGDVAVDDPGAYFDVDTPEDYARVML